MRQLREILKKPGGGALAVSASVFAVFLALSVAAVTGVYGGAAAYLAYALSALALGYTVYALGCVLPRAKAALLDRAGRHKVTAGFVRDYGFRTLVFSMLSFFLNVAFALFNGVMGILSRSVWYGSLAGYYLFLAGLRLGVFRAGSAAGRSADPASGKWRVYRGCGWALFALEIALAAAVAQMAVSENPAAHGQIAAIASAAYAFAKLALAVRNLFKAKKFSDPLVQSLRNINLTDATVSLFALQITLVTVFSDGASDAMRPLNAAVGFAVCALTVGMGIWMIVRANASLKKKEAQEDEQK